MNREQQRINSIQTVFFFVLLSAPFFQIDSLVDVFGSASKVYFACQILAGAAALFLLFRDRLLSKIGRILIPFAALLAVMIIASAVNSGSLKRAVQYAAATLACCLVFEYGILRDLRRFLQAQILFFGALTAANLLTVILFPNGMYTYLGHYTSCWFLGFKSAHITYQLAFLFFAVIYATLCDRKKMWLPRIGVVLVFISNLLVKNSTAIAVLLILGACLFIPRILKFTKVLNAVTYAAAGVFLHLLFVVFRRQDLFEWLIVNILHRKLDLTARIYVWDEAILAIRQHPVIGHGYETFVYPHSDKIITTHNEYLEILFKAGVIGLVLFLIVLGMAVFRLFRQRQRQAAQWTALFLGLFFLMFIVEQYAFVHFVFLLLFAWHVPRLKDLISAQEERRAAELHRETGGTRTASSARNFVFTMLANLLAILIGLIAQRLFLRVLGLEYAGLNGLFANVITMLAIADLGIGEAVVFHLYRPLQEEDRERVRSLMVFYRRAFRTVAVVIGAIGLCLIPLLPQLARPVHVSVNLVAIYLIFLADVVLSYFLSYKRAILYADQKNYVISAIHMAYLIGMNTGQLVMLYITHNYYAYLLIKLAFRILENLWITRAADRRYPYLRGGAAAPLSTEVRADLKKKVGALFLHKIGTFVVNGTDTILISTFLGLVTAGLYNSYYIVIDAVTRLFVPALAALTPSVGNMLVTDEREHRFTVFRRIRFMNFWLACFAATTLFVLIQPFITWWFGAEYLLPRAVVILLSFQFFQTMMRSSYNVFQDAAGIFYENRFVPLVESALNLVASILLLKLFGLAGVFAGTVISSLALWAFSYPKFVYTRLFGRTLGQYAAETLGYVSLFLGIAGLTFAIASAAGRVLAGDSLTQLAVQAVICVVFVNGALVLCFFRSDNFCHFAAMLRSRMQRV